MDRGIQPSEQSILSPPTGRRHRRHFWSGRRAKRGVRSRHSCSGAAMNCSRRFLALSLLLVVSIIAAAHVVIAYAASTPASRRIVSLAPSVTETLFALGFGS